MTFSGWKWNCPNGQ
uniref:Uncharacterized protein n=1 Tax=Arundo donax TaxID=35708 RepID=A0A0A9BVX4_ARUDO